MSELFDFTLISGDQKVKMSQLSSGKIEFDRLKNVASINHDNREIKIIHNGKKFNRRHLNLRTSTISVHPTYVVVDEFTKEISPDTYEISAGKFSIKNGVLFQLFYKGKWYGVILGDSDKLVVDYFSNFELDPKESYSAITKASSSYPDELKHLKAKWQELALLSCEKKNYDQIMEIYELVSTSKRDKNKFLKTQLKEQIKSFMSRYPNSKYNSELQKLSTAF